MVWNLDPVLVDFGFIKIHYYGVIFATGIFIAYLLWKWQMKKQGYTDEQSENFVVWGFLAVIIGARLGHCLFYEPGYFLSRPWEMLYFWKGGLASHGATIALIITLFVYHKWEKIPLLDVLDCFSLSAATGATAVRIGNFMNSEIVGRVTDVPWAMKFPRYAKYVTKQPPLLRHPSQLYEVALGLAVFSIIFFTDRHYGEKRPKGLLSALFLIFYFSGRFIVEYFKEYQALKQGSVLTMGQILSIPFVILGFVMLGYAFKKKNAVA